MKKSVKKQPTMEQNWMSLAFLYNETNQKNLAVTTLREAADAKPSFAKLANCVANSNMSSSIFFSTEAFLVYKYPYFSLPHNVLKVIHVCLHFLSLDLNYSSRKKT